MSIFIRGGALRCKAVSAPTGVWQKGFFQSAGGGKIQFSEHVEGVGETPAEKVKIRRKSPLPPCKGELPKLDFKLKLIVQKSDPLVNDWVSQRCDSPL